MSHIDTGGGKGGRKLNIELNLVPFIDLMSVLITFLLITAVWSQVSMMQIGSSIYGKKTTDSDTTPPPPDADVVLKLDIKEIGYVLTVGAKTMSIVKRDGKFDLDTLTQQLQIIKSTYPAKVDGVISVADTVEYQDLIDSMDRFLTNGFSQIAVATGSPE